MFFASLIKVLICILLLINYEITLLICIPFTLVIKTVVQCILIIYMIMISEYVCLCTCIWNETKNGARQYLNFPIDFERKKNWLK